MTTTVPSSIDTTSPVSPAPASQVPQFRFREAFEAVRPLLASVPDKAVLEVNADIPSAVVTAIGCVPKLQAQRARIAEELPRFDIEDFDRIEQYALAVGWAHTQFRAASAPPEPIAELFAELSSLRELFVTDVTALAKRKFVDSGRLADLKGASGYKNVAFDMLLLCSMLRDNWSSIVGRTGVTQQELDRAEVLAARLATAVGLREQGPVEASRTSDERRRAFTLFINAYEQARRAIAYVRWAEDDVDEVAPSLYANRGNKKKKEEETTQPDAPPAPAPFIAAGNVDGHGNGSAPPPAAGVGLPGSNPFENA